MKRKIVVVYGNLSGKSGILAYEAGTDHIVVRFIGGGTYLYTYNSAGRMVIERMKRLAKSGKGLSTYISQTVKDRYKKQLSP